MGFDLVSIQDEITRLIRVALPNTVVDEDGVLDDENLKRDPSGQLIPYVVPRYGSIRRSPNGRSLSGVRRDEYYSTVDVSCVAPRGRMARQMLDVITDALIGARPNPVEMAPEGLPDNFTIMNNVGRPTAFVASLRFRHGADAVDADTHLAPPAP